MYGHGLMHGLGFEFYGENGWILMILNFVLSLGGFAGVILLLNWIIGKNNLSGKLSSSVNISPREILKSRYASGDISQEQYKSDMKIIKE